MFRVRMRSLIEVNAHTLVSRLNRMEAECGHAWGTDAFKSAWSSTHEVNARLHFQY